MFSEFIVLTEVGIGCDCLSFVIKLKSSIIASPFLEKISQVCSIVKISPVNSTASNVEKSFTSSPSLAKKAITSSSLNKAWLCFKFFINSMTSIFGKNDALIIMFSSISTIGNLSAK